MEKPKIEKFQPKNNPNDNLLLFIREACIYAEKILTKGKEKFDLVTHIVENTIRVTEEMKPVVTTLINDVVKLKLHIEKKKIFCC